MKTKFEYPSMALLKGEFITGLRQTQFFVLLLIILLSMGAIELITWPSDNSYMYMDVNYHGKALFYAMMATLAGAGGLLIPGVAGASITREKERDTFEMLHMTLISSRGMVVAKILDSMGMFLLITLLSLPFFGVILFLGGVDWTEVIAIYLYILVMAVYCAAWGVLASTIFKTSGKAILASYFFILATTVGFPIFFGIMREIVGIYDIGRLAELYFKLVFPIVAFEDHNSFAESIPGLIYQIGVIVAVSAVSIKILNRPPPETKIDSSKPIDNAKVLADRRAKFPYFLIDPLRRKKEIGDKINPMMAKELWWGAWGRATMLVRAFYVALILFLFLGLISPLPIIVVSLIVAPSFVATLASKEYDQGGIDMLRMTLLTPRQIVMGKLWAGAVSLAPIMIAATIIAVMVFLLPIETGALKYLYLIFTPITLATCLATSASAGIFASVVERKTSGAVVLGYALNGLIYFGLPAGIVIFNEINHHFMNYDLVDFFIKMVSPFVSFAGLDNYARGSTRHSEDLACLIVSLIFYWLLTFVFASLSVIVFKLRHMRDK